MSVTQSTPCRVFFALQLILCVALPSASARGADQPNVILILTDDQGYGDMSCHGNPVLKTPSIDDLYRESVRLTNFHVDPTCSPTRAALMTGKYSTRVGVWLTYMGRHHLRADESTMAEVFSRNGYRTAIYGKWHLGDNYPFRPNDRGFDQSLIHGGGVVGETPDHWGNDYYDDTYLRNGQPEQVTGYCTDVWFNEAVKFIEKNKDDRFFIYLPANAPHGPFHVPEEYVKPYQAAGEPHSRAQFYGCIAKIDENIGRLRKRLDELKLSENTLLIFMTDNGTTAGYTGKNDSFPIDGYNAGMRGRKATAYEGGHRAACFLHWPGGGVGGIEHAGDADTLTAHFDLLPTLIDVCGLQLADSNNAGEFDGTSLRPLLMSDGKTDSWPDRTLFVHHQGRFGTPIEDDRPINQKHYAVMKNRWRLVGHERNFALYDVLADPAQTSDVQKENPEIVQELRRKYQAWWTDVTRRSDEYARTIVGAPQQSVTKLTSQQWHSPRSAYNQFHVRNGFQVNGFVDLEIASEVTYDIELRRWPRELDLPMNALVQPPELDPALYDGKNRNAKLPGRKFEFVTSRLKIGDKEQFRQINPTDKSVLYSVNLKTGPANLQTWLTEANGNSVGAYFVYVSKSSSPLESKTKIDWKRHRIVDHAKSAINSAVASDFDRDGFVDVIASYEGGVFLHRGPNWRRVQVDKNDPSRSRNKPRPACIHSCLMDVDGDGDQDFIGSNLTVFWLECPAEPFSGDAWTYRTIDDEILGTHCVLAGDVNRDGKMDLIANSSQDQAKTDYPQSITWLEVPNDPLTASRWIRHVFADRDAPGGSHYMGLGDLNADGRPDITCAAKGEPFEGGNWFAWWEQPEDADSVWEKHVLSKHEIGASNIEPADFDGDDHPDIVATRGHGQGVLWFKGPDFEPFDIDAEIEGPHTLVVADLDQDGDQDVAVCGRDVNGNAVWYQNDGSGNFASFKIDEQQGSYDLRAIDMDGDGDLDLLNAGHNNNNIVWYENILSR